MAQLEDIEGLVAEYVLGTLDSGERQEVERAMAADPEIKALVESWERRLSPLALALQPVEAPPGLRAKVLAAIAAASDGQSQVISLLERRLVRWRGAAIAGMAVAAALAVALVAVPRGGPEAGRYVAVLESQGPGPAFVASVDLARGTITVRAVSATVPSGKSYELWAIGAGRDKPQSLGVISADYRVPSDRLGRLDPKDLGATTFAVSLEPEGGSPTGQPTGPVVFTGALVPTE
jgi:anti-sigma-K factor RskA